MAIAFVKGFGRFWYDFIVGDDWKIAAAIVTALGIGAGLVASEAMGGTALVVAGGIGVFVAFVISLIVDVRTH